MYLRKQLLVHSKLITGALTHPGHLISVSFQPQPPLLSIRLFPSPSQAYYCLIDTRQSGLTREESPGDGDVSKQFLLCFVSIGRQGLDLYPLYYLLKYQCCFRVALHIRLSFSKKAIKEGKLCFSFSWPN